MPLIDTSGLMETAARLSALSALVKEAQGTVPESVTVVDPTRSLRVVLRGDGVVDDFQILKHWKERIPPGRLGAAISDLLAQARQELYADYEAVMEGGAARLEAEWSSRTFNVLTDPVAQEMRDSAQELLERSKGMVVPSAQAFSDARDYVDRVIEAVAEAESGELEEADDDAPVRCVRSNGVITSVFIDGNWASSTPTPTLRSEITDALLVDVDEESGDDKFSLLSEEGDQVFEQLIGNIAR